MREWHLLSHVFKSNASLAERVTIPPGDDMGAVTLRGRDLLVTVDQLADAVHFDLRTTPIEKIGRKAITRNLSDVAAMAAMPVAAVAAASLPRSLGEPKALQLFDALRATADRYDCPLVGGDVSIWDGPLLLAVTIFAEPAAINPLRRRGAQPGDTIYVTGAIGGSLQSIDGYTHHLDFEPRLDIARTLAQNPATRPHCMIDLSDGLASDLRHLCDAGNVSADILQSQLPLSPAVQPAAARSGLPAWRHAVGDGEDYELLFTATANIPDHIAGVPITAIGRIRPLDDAPRVRLIQSDGAEIDLANLGWEHHA